jgi:hypothetical protein
MTKLMNSNTINLSEECRLLSEPGHKIDHPWQQSGGSGTRAWLRCMRELEAPQYSEPAL